MTLKISGKNILIFSLILILTNSMPCIDGYCMAELYYDHTITFQTSYSIIQFQVNQNILQIFTDQHQVIAFDALTFDPNGDNMLSDLWNISNIRIANIFLQAWGWQQNSFLIDEMGEVYSYDMKNHIVNYQFPTDGFNNNSIFATQNSIYAINSIEGDQILSIIYRYDRNNNFNLLEVMQTQIKGLTHIQAYQNNNLNMLQTVVVWNNTGAIQVFNCTTFCDHMFYLSQDIYILNTTISHLLLLGSYTIIVDYSNVTLLKSYNLEFGISYYQLNYNNSNNETILSLQFIDSWLKNFGAFYTNNSLVVYQAWGSEPYTYLYQYDNFHTITSFSRIDYITSQIYVASPDRIEVYKMVCHSQTYMQVHGLCAPCDVNCQQCDTTSGLCNICKSSYYLDTGICYYQYNTLNSTSNSTSSNSTSSNSTSSNGTSNSTQNSTSSNGTLNNTLNNSLNNTFNSTINDTLNNTLNGTLNNITISIQLNDTQPQFLSPQEQILQGVVYSTIDATAQLVGKAFLILQIAPLAWLFLQFINYWNVCSFYLLINITKPSYLNEFLSKVYNAINASVFQQLGINLKIPLNNHQLVKNQNFLQYQISSNFFSASLQGIILILFICFLLILVKMIKNLFSQRNWIHKVLKFDNFLIIVGQYIPLMSTIFLPISFIYNYHSYSNFSSKINLLFNLLFVGISILTPFLLLAHFQIVKDYKLCSKSKKTNQIQIQKKSLNLEQYNWFFYSVVNISISFIISFQNPLAFLICNLICFTFGIFLAFKSSYHRLNNIILSLHIFFYHLGFIGMFVSYSYSDKIYHYFSTIALLFFFTGALHEILTVFIESFIKIYQWIIKRAKKISPNIQNKREEIQRTNNFEIQSQRTQHQIRKQNSRPRYKVTLKKRVPPQSKPQNRKEKTFALFKEGFSQSKLQKRKEKTFALFKESYQQEQINPTTRTNKCVTFTKKYKVTKIPEKKNELIIKYINNIKNAQN